MLSSWLGAPCEFAPSMLNGGRILMGYFVSLTKQGLDLVGKCSVALYITLGEMWVENGPVKMAFFWLRKVTLGVGCILCK